MLFGLGPFSMSSAWVRTNEKNQIKMGVGAIVAGGFGRRRLLLVF